MAGASSELLAQLSALSDGGAHEGPPATGGSHKGWPPRKKTLEEEDEERFGCAWPELDDKLRFHPNWEMRRDTLYYVRDNARKKDPRVMATLKYLARRDPNVNVKLTAAEILIHVGMQTLPEQIWMLGNEDWYACSARPRHWDRSLGLAQSIFAAPFCIQLNFCCGLRRRVGTFQPFCAAFRILSSPHGAGRALGDRRVIGGCVWAGCRARTLSTRSSSQPSLRMMLS